MTDDELKQDRAIVDAAITAPWMAWNPTGEGWVVVDGNGFWVANCDNDESSAKAIAAARTRWPAALDEVERLKAELVNVLASAGPNERDHQTMSKAWQRAKAFLEARKEKP